MARQRVAAHGVNPFAAIVSAALIAAVISLPVSVLVLRLSGGYFAVATLVIVGGLAVAATLVSSRGLWGFAAERFGWSLLPVGYGVRPPRE